MRERYVIHDASSAMAVAAALAVSRASRLWRQRGLGTAFKWMGRVPGFSRARCEVEFAPGCHFDTRVFEPYWAPTVIGGRAYEPELLRVFRWVADLGPTLIDCGANFGFWSILATGPEVGFPHALAIEASPSTFTQLRRNAALNGDRFQCLHRAVDESSGGVVHLRETSHATAHVDAGGSGTPVETITIDDAVALAKLVDAGPFVLKLDVENHERAALRGATELLRRDHLICIEDFADNDGFAHVAFLLEGGYEVFWVDGESEGDRCHAIRSVADARVSLRTQGNAKNFFAAKAPGKFAERLHAKIVLGE